MANLQKMIVAGVLVLIMILGATAYSVLRAPAEASKPIEALPLATSAAASASAAPTVATAAATTAPTDPAATTDSSATEAAAPNAAAAPGASSPIVAQIIPEESEARFIIDEVLNNAPKTVVGTTNQVAGEIAVDPDNLSQSQLGTIQVNARTLTTDSEFRNRAIKNRILLTDQYEFITFTPKQLVGLPQSATIGQSYSFQIVGDLTIRDATREVTFDVTATPASDTRLEGTAKTTISYADYGITIPRVPQVASVAEQVRLEIDFVAVPK
ncbi:MAG TPA: YceI family protein [Herpetosiphonaceae bacterium]